MRKGSRDNRPFFARVWRRGLLWPWDWEPLLLFVLFVACVALLVWYSR